MTRKPRMTFKTSCGIDGMLKSKDGMIIYRFVEQSVQGRKWVAKRTIAFDFEEKYPETAAKFGRKMLQTLVSRALRHNGFEKRGYTGRVYDRVRRTERLRDIDSISDSGDEPEVERLLGEKSIQTDRGVERDI